MDHFYVIIDKLQFRYYFPSKTIANFKTKLATPIELQPDKWKVAQVNVCYPKWNKKRFLYNTIHLD